MTRVQSTATTIEYDGNTGEITKSKETIVTAHGSEPDYVKLYLQDILYLKDMPPQYSAVLLSLLKRASYAGDDLGMCVVLAPIIRKQICEEVNLKGPQSLANVLQKLVKGEILIWKDRGVYQLNPWLFGKGKWADISSLRLEVNYYPNSGRTFKTVIENACNKQNGIAPVSGSNDSTDDNSNAPDLDLEESA